jgi:signal transduction histidine kinase
VDRVLGEVAPEALDFIGKGVQRMDGLLSGLLKVSRADRVVATPRVLDMNLLVRKVTSAVEFQVRCSRVALVIEPLPPCLGDPSMMEQVLGNLLDNALKYREPTRAARITIRGEVRDDETVYCVEDNGIGIAPEHVPQVFLMFHRLDPDRVQGEGIGLTIVRTLLERQGGRVWVESRPGEGSRFQIALPTAPGPAGDPEGGVPA